MHWLRQRLSSGRLMVPQPDHSSRSDPYLGGAESIPSGATAEIQRDLLPKVTVPDPSSDVARNSRPLRHVDLKSGADCAIDCDQWVDPGLGDDTFAIELKSSPNGN